MDKNKLRKILIITIALVLTFFISKKSESQPIENLVISSGVGIDISKITNDNINYRVSLSSYVFENGSNIQNKVFVTEGPTVSSNRDKRQMQSNKRFIVGFERVYIIGEDYANYGIKDEIDILQKNPWVNENGYFVVCKGKAEDIIKLNIEGYPTSADYIEGLIDMSRSGNFFSKNYTLTDTIKEFGSEGYNHVMPYIEVENGSVSITGLAVFNKDKMIEKLDMYDTRILNILRGTKGTGIIEIQKNPKQYIGYESKCKRKVKCYKSKDGYKFIIDLKFEGNIIQNELYNNIIYDTKLQEEFEQDMANKITSMCCDFIDKMQKDYKIDMLNLGSIAAAKYGRHMGKDWNEEVSKAEITVNVEVKLDQSGKGDY